MAEWRDIDGWPGYAVSDDGRVRSRYFGGKEKVLWPDKDGYLHVALYRKGRQGGPHVARLVLMHFVGPPPEGRPQAMHRDGDLTNNRVENLKWASQKEVCDERGRRGHTVQGVAHHLSKLTLSKARKIRALSKRGLSDKEIAAKFGVIPATVWWVRTGRTWTMPGAQPHG